MALTLFIFVSRRRFRRLRSQVAHTESNRILSYTNMALIMCCVLQTMKKKKKEDKNDYFLVGTFASIE